MLPCNWTQAKVPLHGALVKVSFVHLIYTIWVKWHSIIKRSFLAETTWWNLKKNPAWQLKLAKVSSFFMFVNDKKKSTSFFCFSIWELLFVIMHLWVKAFSDDKQEYFDSYCQKTKVQGPQMPSGSGIRLVICGSLQALTLGCQKTTHHSQFALIMKKNSWELKKPVENLF